MKAVTDSINLKDEKLTRKDVVIICGGTRDIAKNEANAGLRYISQFANSAADTNVIVMCAPTHFDLQSLSCVNKEVASFNIKLQKSMKIFSHVQVCSMSSNCNHYTTHGFHMNARGKHWITKTWASIIKTLRFSSPSKHIFPLPEKNKYLENPVFPANNSCDNNTMICVAQDKVTVCQEVNPNAAISNEPTKCKLRASCPKKPLDKKEDFLWY
jgi:hypothetical protein